LARSPTAETTLVHGDCYPENVLIHNDYVRAVDWEWVGL
jgi:thiamine kinase-like enzyme